MPIIFTITLPDEGDEATLLVKKGNVAHLLRFKADSREAILFAMLSAQTEIEALEANPPQIEIPTNEITVSKDKSTKASKPKKKKVSLDDVPEGEGDAEEVLVEVVPEAEPKLAQSEQPMPMSNASVQVGDVVHLNAGTVDVDGDPIAFEQGRILEIDDDAETSRVWIESLDGEQDAWVRLDVL